MPASGDGHAPVLTALVVLIPGAEKGQRRGQWSARLSRVGEGFQEERFVLQNDGEVWVDNGWAFSWGWAESRERRWNCVRMAIRQSWPMTWPEGVGALTVLLKMGSPPVGATDPRSAVHRRVTLGRSWHACPLGREL